MEKREKRGSSLTETPIEEIKRVRAEKAAKEKRNAKSVERGKEKIPQLSLKIANLFILKKDCFNTFNHHPDAYMGSGYTLPAAELNAEIPMEEQKPLRVSVLIAIDYYHKKLDENLTPEEKRKIEFQKAIHPLLGREKLPDKDQLAEQLAEKGTKGDFRINVEDYGHILLGNSEDKEARIESEGRHPTSFGPIIYGPGGHSTTSPDWTLSASEKDIDRAIGIIETIIENPEVKLKGRITRVKSDEFGLGF